MLNEHQRSYLRITFQTVDASLADALAVLDSSAERSPFSELAADATPVQRQAALGYAARIRAAMRRILHEQGIPLPGATRSAVWSARTSLLSAIIALEEAAPERLRGFGELPPDDARAVEVALAEVDELLDKLAAYLAQGPGAQLGERLARLRAAGDEVELLRKLERVVATRGLLEFRGALEILLERIEHPRLEVAVFGRVSSGKSSLLNYVLDAAVLPVGVTPVTTVPTRIVYGPRARAVVEFAEDEPCVIAPHEIVHYASERENPGNAKRVTRILVELPAGRLREGVMLVDTPGVGSLALRGGEESLAYLPRCDLGIVLVDAASTLVAEDVTLVDLLQQAGAEVQVLLSKADALTEADRAQAIAYVRDQLRDQTGRNVPTFAVSVRGEAAALSDRWIEAALAPAVAQRRELAEESLRRKLGALRDAVAAALRRALARSSGSPSDESWRNADVGLNKASLHLQQALRRFRDAMTPSDAVADEVLRVAAQRLVQAWTDGSAADRRTGGEVARVAAEFAADMSAERLEVLRTAEETAARALRAAAAALDGKPPEGDLAAIGDMPLFASDARRFDAVVKPAWRRALGTSVVGAYVLKTLNAAIGNAVEDALLRYARLLDAWCAAKLQELARAFAARADMLRASAPAAPMPVGASPEGIARDLAELEPALNRGADADEPTPVAAVLSTA